MTTGTHSTRWLSQGFEVLVADIAKQPGDATTPHFDVLIVGSGYGGAIAAAGLAGSTTNDNKVLKVGVLERGNEYLAGMFPADMTELPAHVRLKIGGKRGMVGNKEGLFDLRPGADVNVLVANGLGGGSLINAGVMAEPASSVIDALPDSLGRDLRDGDYFRHARLMLGAAELVNGVEELNTIERHATHNEQPVAKFSALQRLAPSPANQNRTFSAAPITVAMATKLNHAGILLTACTRCGDCATGCNYGAKDSLDLNLLVTAQQRGAEIFTGVTVTRLERGKGDWWNIEAVFTDDRLRQLHEKTTIRATRVILAAGTLGSTELLLRSASDELRFSPRLGRGFSSNGDMLAFGYGELKAVNAIAFAEIPGRDRKIGPTITGMLDLRNEDPAIVIEEMAVPAGLRRLVEEVTATTNTLHALGERDSTPHGYGHPGPDPFAIQPDTVRKTSVIAMMGDDGAEGAIELIESDSGDEPDGGVHIVWPNLRDHSLFDAQIKRLKELHDKAKTRARVMANPVWQLLPENVARLLDNRKGPPLTVHPLGGCAIGKTVGDGVVNKFGQVFDGADPSSTAVYESLVVLDGSIIPRALGINPALTIAAVALHAVKTLRDETWKLVQGGEPSASLPPRPVYRAAPVPDPATVRATEARFVERLSGEVEVAVNRNGTRKLFVELTLEYEHKTLLDLVGGNGARALTVDGGANPAGKCRSQLRVFDAVKYATACQCNAFAQELDDELEGIAELIAPLSGTLTILRRERSRSWQRVWRALWGAWLPNRGLRDMWQAGEKALGNLWHRISSGESRAEFWLKEIPRALLVSPVKGLVSITGKIRDLIAVASRAGEVRLFEYDLKIGQPSHSNGELLLNSFAGSALTGVKRITYARRCNPWRQVMELELTRFPGLDDRKANPVLTLDTVYLADRRTPLFRLVEQQDQVTALADLASFLGYFLRMFLGIHIWSFRKPDEPTLREPQRLPGVIPGLPEPHVHYLDVDTLKDGTPVRIRLTRYPCPDSRKPPIIMIHGYSASGTTFAHPAVRPNLASYFHDKNRDVWILDMRTSSGMPTATEPWSFEEVAYADIPAAFDFVWRHTGRQKLDVIAHCMGSAMLSMAILTARQDIEPEEMRQRGWPWGDCFRTERKALPDRIGHLALTQVGPLVVFSPANILRAYAFSYLQQFLPLEGYRFRVGPNPSLTDQLIDRLLATMPYPKEEFDLENPPWPPWRRTAFTGPRHRMDALYGRDFKLTNISREILDHIDDHFGPLSIDTLNQTIEFALLRTITDHRGRNIFVSRENLNHCWKFPTLSVHGVENGLSDVKTLYRMREILQAAGRQFEILPVPGYGHQDALIGTGADQAVYDHIDAFFANGAPSAQPSTQGTRDQPQPKWLARIPESGPVIGRPSFDQSGFLKLSVRCGADPVLGECDRVVFLPVRRGGGKISLFTLPGTGAQSTAVTPASLVTAVTTDRSEVDGHWRKLTISVPSQWQSADGLLVLLVYDQIRGLAPGRYRQEDTQMVLRSLSPGTATRPASRDQIGQALAVSKALQRPAADLEPGIIELQRLRPTTAKGEITFALGSCQYPAGMLDRRAAFGSFRRLADTLEKPDDKGALRLALLVGDQVYVDATAGLFDPASTHDRFQKPHEALFGNKHVRNVLRRLPSEMMLDDHEIADNWEPRHQRPSGPEAWQTQLWDGVGAYLKYQRGADQPARAHPNPRWYSADRCSALWHSFNVNEEFRFFMLDTRTDRDPRRAANAATANIISSDQMTELTAWIQTQADQRDPSPAFIVSPSVLLPRHRIAVGNVAHALRSDTWDGYPASLHALLALLCDLEAKRIVFLSGDLHLSGITRATIERTGKRVVIHSICSSGLYAPFPFANAREADLITTETFTFCHGNNSYTCTVESRTVSGDGFALLKAYKDGSPAGWKLKADFQRDYGTPPLISDLD